jgi:hypothetical protein
VNYAAKNGLLSNCLWMRPQSRGHMRSLPKVISRNGASAHQTEIGKGLLNRRLVTAGGHVKEGAWKQKKPKTTDCNYQRIRIVTTAREARESQDNAR